MKYIAYGSNMSAGQMAHRCQNAQLIGTGWIERARLEFYLHATVERTRRKADRVPVAVWEVDDADMRRLDYYEGYPRYYIKDVWTAHMDDGSQIEGTIYLMSRSMLRMKSPSVTYYNGIRDAYADLGLGSQISTVLLPALARSLERCDEVPAASRSKN